MISLNYKKLINQEKNNKKLFYSTTASSSSKKGRFIDFIKEDILKHSDQDLGSAVRFVHQGCNEVMKEYFAISPLSQKDEVKKYKLTKIIILTNFYYMKISKTNKSSLLVIEVG